VLGAALLTATMASITGGAGPLSFLLGIVAGFFLVLIFAELARHFASAGAVYAYAGLMAGVNSAFVIGRIYVLMMMAFWGATLSATANFFNSTLNTASAGAHVLWVLIAIVTWAVVGYLVSRKIAIRSELQVS
jgi:amino acid transporter